MLHFDPFRPVRIQSVAILPFPFDPLLSDPICSFHISSFPICSNSISAFPFISDPLRSNLIRSVSTFSHPICFDQFRPFRSDFMLNVPIRFHPFRYEPFHSVPFRTSLSICFTASPFVSLRHLLFHNVTCHFATSPFVSLNHL